MVDLIANDDEVMFAMSQIKIVMFAELTIQRG